MTPLALLDLAERLDESAAYLSADDAEDGNMLCQAADALRRRVERELGWIMDES